MGRLHGEGIKERLPNPLSGPRKLPRKERGGDQSAGMRMRSEQGAQLMAAAQRAGQRAVQRRRSVGVGPLLGRAGEPVMEMRQHQRLCLLASRLSLQRQAAAARCTWPRLSGDRLQRKRGSHNSLS